jgi:two-component system, NtrC family, nitrogen regulation sensor histidine kinase NtrY
MALAVRPANLRARLLAAFALVSLPPLLVLTVAVLLLVNRAFETAVTRQLEQGLRTSRGRLETLERRAESEMTAVAEEVELATGDERTAGAIAERHQLQALEILDPEGRVLSSAHWAAGFGLPDRDQTYGDAPGIRLEIAAAGYGSTERLTLTAARGTSWTGRPAVVRGGYFLDDRLWGEMHDLLGLEVGLWDAERRSFVTRTGSPFLSWRPTAPHGEAALGPGGVHRWTSARRGSDLTLYVAAPTGDWDALAHRVRATSLAMVGFSIVVSIGFALALARRIAGPATALALAAERVAAGDLSVQAPVSGDGELADLARAFNRMTSDLRAAQERLVQAERVAAWREIARRLAHELKNPIFPIALSMQTVQRATAGVVLPSPGGTDLNKLLGESIGTTLDELRRLQRVVDEFSAFARMPQPQLRPTDLGAVVRDVAALYQARATAVTLDVTFDPKLPLVLADGDLLVRAVGNLVANALDAMVEGGSLSLRTLRRDDGAVIEVEDSGPGLTEEQKSRLFTPYFTTKPGGTGLGLAIVQGIASDLGGRVEVRPGATRGTVFSIVLPSPAMISAETA